MPGLSIHVVDVSRGVVAAGMAVEVAFMPDGGARRVLASGTISAKGALEHPALATTFAAGRYQVVLQVGDYYRTAHIGIPEVPFLDAVTYDFGIADPGQHYHLPFKCTPWGYSCFRGGT